MAQIIVLDEQLANQIAAGEVVERPASIVKELVENAIDADSTSIKIEIKEGGLDSIKVIDNGSGIEKEDCLLSFERHATSKIKRERDLFAIQSLGFRGEALPSIASVAKVEMITSTGKGPGTLVVIEAGKLIEQSLAPSRKGTEVTVSQLFFNTPARLKHLKSVNTELGNITDVVQRLALAHPMIAFQLIHNGRPMLQTDGKGDLLQGIAAIYGFNVARKMVALDAETLDFKVTGFTTKPEETRATRKYLSLFINGRYIRHYALAKAIIEGYHTLLPIGRYPITILHIEMDPTLVDINVHPAKLEARLSKEQELVQLIKQTIRSALHKADLIPKVSPVTNKEEKAEQRKLSFQFRTNHHEKRELKNFLQSMEDEAELSVPPVAGKKDREMIKETANATTVREEPNQKHQLETLYPIGQVHGTYIVAQNEKGLYLIDQHAAEERVKYEYFYHKLGEAPRDLQQLLMPLSFEFTSSEAQFILENEHNLQQLGIFFEPFGDRTYIVRAHPSWFPKGKEEETIKRIVEFVLEENKYELRNIREEAAIMMACKLSIKANHSLNKEEMLTLLQSLILCQDPFTCPHGRPVIIHFSTYELEKLFKRVM